MRAIASACKNKVKDIWNKDKLNEPAKFLQHSTNLTFDTNLSAEALWSSNNSTPNDNAFEFAQSSTSTLPEMKSF